MTNTALVYPGTQEIGGSPAIYASVSTRKRSLRCRLESTRGRAPAHGRGPARRAVSHCAAGDQGDDRKEVAVKAACLQQLSLPRQSTSPHPAGRGWKTPPYSARTGRTGCGALPPARLCTPRPPQAADLGRAALHARDLGRWQSFSDRWQSATGHMSSRFGTQRPCVEHSRRGYFLEKALENARHRLYTSAKLCYDLFLLGVISVRQ